MNTQPQENEPTAAALFAELKRLIRAKSDVRAQPEQHGPEADDGHEGECVHVVGDAALRAALRANPRLMGE